MFRIFELLYDIKTDDNEDMLFPEFILTSHSQASCLAFVFMGKKKKKNYKITGFT